MAIPLFYMKYVHSSIVTGDAQEAMESLVDNEKG